MDLPTLQSTLLAWFATAGRDLPWRQTRDPYRILVSEVMLQQTQVDRVRPKYAAFLAAFPTLEALAAAPTAEVIRQWAGLGYNRRAVNLQRAARAVLDQHQGQFPRDVAALRALPGIGPYTAGALACFAFEHDLAFIDTNIRRVVRRVFVGPERVPPATSEADLLRLASAAVPPGQGWAWNQALIELGALICTAATPACWRCPLQAGCQAYATWQANDRDLFSDGWPRLDAPQPARRVAERRGAPFVGSSRWFRGRIVDLLRKLPPGASLSFDALLERVATTETPLDMPRLRDLVAALARDGLVLVEDEHLRLPA